MNNVQLVYAETNLFAQGKCPKCGENSIFFGERILIENGIEVKCGYCSRCHRDVRTTEIMEFSLLPSENLC